MGIARRDAAPPRPKHAFQGEVAASVVERFILQALLVVVE
jgi:hypothetical protein